MPAKTLPFHILNSQLALDEMKITQRNQCNLPNSEL